MANGSSKLSIVREYFGANAAGEIVSAQDARSYMKEFGRDAWNELAEFCSEQTGIELTKVSAD